ncbi:hypothetical protein GOBAR_AA39790 [Gossypium barbadense]|uniref:UTP--glucose-1-phosphate uridylyltransferase n=1 Tax=Gossypium barbadense TaxID=3634 RepID=A0A2P5VPZ9_GOSBA|nr:hypothetical protein GOBAR_AA39790 [Gossypium barbadense]
MTEDDKSGFINFVSRNLNEEKPLIEWSKVEIPTEYEMIVPYHILPPVPDDATETRRLLDKVVVLRLNGDLGTAMGSDGPKSLIEVRHNYNFIELVVIQIEVMYSPGHGEVFQCLRNSGMLDEFISQEKEILFFANIDNLGALLDFRILKNMVENQKEFCMELTPKTSHDQMTGTHISYEGKVQEVHGTKVVQFETVADDAIKCDIYTLVGYVFKRKSKAKPLDPIIEFGSEFFKGKVSIAARAGGQLQIPDKKVIEHKEINGPEDLCEFTARVPGLP